MSERKDQGQERLKKKAQREGDVFELSRRMRWKNPKSDVGFRGKQ